MSLLATATDMVAAFEGLLHRLVAPQPEALSRQNSVGVSSEGSEATSSEEGRAITELLAAWDAAWVPYLEQFVAWKGADASTLEVRLGHQRFSSCAGLQGFCPAILHGFALF